MATDKGSAQAGVSLDRALQMLEASVLIVLAERGWDECETPYLSLKTIARKTGLPVEVVRGLVRGLKERGLTSYRRGLWTDDGEPAGSGYAVTRAGWNVAQTVLLRDCPDGLWRVH